MRSTEALTSLALGLLWVALPALAAGPDEKAWVGSETCQTCHEDLFNGLRKNPHQVIKAKGMKGLWKGQACESCHGPGGKHAESASAEDISNPGKLTGVNADKQCLTCHLNRSTHTGRIFGSHARAQASCASCHSVHHGGDAGMVARRTQEVNRQCSVCHTSTAAEFRKPHAHRVPENAMSCTNCHNPHGTTQPQQTRAFAGNEPGCFSCHSDKRGPFTFEHAPMRLEGCRACHEPHGSQNPRMLIRSEVRQLCLECHANLGAQTAASRNLALGSVPPAFHDLRSPRFQNCTICHQKIHGSHVDRNFLR